MRFMHLLSGVTLLFAWCAPLLGEEQKGHITVEQLPLDREEQFLKSAFNGSALLSTPLTNSIYTDRADADAWAGNNPHLVAQILKAHLRFKKAELQGTRDEVSGFDVILDFATTETRLIHTYRRKGAREDGYTFPINPSDRTQFLLEGGEDTSIAVLLPPVASADHNVRAFMMCPRRFQQIQTTKGKRLALLESNYQLARSLFAVQGKISGGTVSGGGVGFARVALLTTPNIPRSAQCEDEAFMRDPALELEYVPLAKEELDRDSSMIGAISAQLEFHRPSGHRRVSTARDVVWIKEIALTKEQAWFVPRGRTAIRVGPGVCYIVYKEQGVEHRFSREPLILPERLREP